jgi:hypothetical protein
MGHRALVAYARPDRLYDLRYSHWGGEALSFAARITRETPLADGAIEVSLLADAVTRDRLLAAFLDPRTAEALYVVDLVDETATRAYRVPWLEWDAGRVVSRGALVELSPEEDCEFRTWFRATKTVLGDVVEMGQLSEPAARTHLKTRVCEEYGGTPYTYSGDGTR